MPEGKKAGQACVHLDESKQCQLFDDERRPQCCHDFKVEIDVCLTNSTEALEAITWLELETQIIS